MVSRELPNSLFCEGQEQVLVVLTSHLQVLMERCYFGLATQPQFLFSLDLSWTSHSWVFQARLAQPRASFRCDSHCRQYMYKDVSVGVYANICLRRRSVLGPHNENILHILLTTFTALGFITQRSFAASYCDIFGTSTIRAVPNALDVVGMLQFKLLLFLGFALELFDFFR